MLVIDASIAGPLSLPDEVDKLTVDNKEQLMSAILLVPQHWRLEVTNMLRTAVRRGRLRLDQRAGVLARLATLNPEVDRRTGEMAWTDALGICDRHDLTPYDAAYLELTIRRQTTLATLDRGLARAARAEGVQLAIAP